MAEFPYSPGLYKLSHQGKQLLRHSRTFPEGSLKSCCSFRKILRKPRSTLSRSRIQMFGGHMKRIGIMGTAIMNSVQSVVAVALRVPAVACSAPAGAPEKHAPVAASAVAG